jgi:hypothetical protein
MEEILIDYLGFPGVMISGSKSGYRDRHPKNLVVFNGNVCVGLEKVWWGDVDITSTKDTLISLSKVLNNVIFILNEMDGRFENEDEPLIGNYIAKFLPDGTYQLNENIKNRYDITRIERLD